MAEQAMRDEFEEVHSRIYPQDKCTRLPNGNYSGWVKQQHWQDFQVSYEHREASNVELTEEEQQEFIRFVSRWSVRCEFEGQKLIVPPGQGHSVGLAVRTAFEAWKYQIKKARHQKGEPHAQ